MDASDGMLGGTTSSELLAYYKKRCEDFEASEAETLGPGLAAWIEACSLADQVILCPWQ